MPITPTYPGVYVEEIPSGVRTIVGVATSITAFIGRAMRGETDRPISIGSLGDFEREFGGLWAESALGYSVRSFYLNGGGEAIVVRLYHADPDDPTGGVARLTVSGLKLQARSPGSWGARLRARVDKNVAAESATALGVEVEDLFNLTVTDDGTGEEEIFRNFTAKPSARRVDQVLRDGSRLVRWDGDFPDDPPAVSFGPDALTRARLLRDAAAARLAASQELDQVSGAAQPAPTAVDAAKAKLVAARTDYFEAKAADAGWTLAAAQAELDKAKAAQQAADARKQQAGEALTAAGNALTAAETALQAAQQALDAATGATPPDPAAVAAATAERDRCQQEVDQRQAAKDAAQQASDQASADATTAKNAADAAQQAADTAKTARDAAQAEVAQAGNVPADETAKATTDLTAASGAFDTALAPVNAGDGLGLETSDFSPPHGLDDKKGLYALEDADLFNLLVIPPYLPSGDVDPGLIEEAAPYCERRRAMLLVDPPAAWSREQDARLGKGDIGTSSKNAALFFPRLEQRDPLRDNRLETFAPSGAVAGVFARTDATRGVWKAPAGQEAILNAVVRLSVPLTDSEIGRLNPLGINCLRSIPAVGPVVWGARTLQGDDRLTSEWKYVPIRRLALYIEESLYRGTQWVVFEPNDEPLWAQIRLNVGAFMHDLFRQGAFQGQSPNDAYQVKVDKETTTQSDINRGIVNIVVGFAPLKPAEFVFLKIRQLAGQIEV
jgi:Bacteriophage tail sheath protein